MKTSVRVPPIAVVASTTNRYVQILCEMQFFYLLFLLPEILSVEHISIFVSYNLTLSDYFLRLSENAFSALFIYLWKNLPDSYFYYLPS